MLFIFLPGDHNKTHSMQCNLVEQITDGRGSAALLEQEGEHQIKQEKEVLIGNAPILWVAMATQDSDTVGHESETLEEAKKRMERQNCVMFNCQMFIVFRMRTH